MIRLLISSALFISVFMQSAAAQQEPLSGSLIPQFVDPLPTIPVVDGTEPLELHMREFQAQVLPTGTFIEGEAPGTWVWGYIVGPDAPAGVQSTYVGPVITAVRNVPTEITYVNDLGSTSSSNVLAYTQSTDQTIHWADPQGLEANACAEQAMMSTTETPPSEACSQHYNGSIPVTVHLHGGEVPPVLDGNPDSWWTSDGLARGSAFYSRDLNDSGNSAIYRYPNSEDSAPLWFHDHTLGVTRLNVYMGLAGMYLITDPENDPQNLPPPIPLVIQDRMFDVNGELFFPAGPGTAPNPIHPYWAPEFFGDVIVVNGRAWPFMEVEPRRYRFIVLNAANARAFKMKFTNESGRGPVPRLWQIGTDGGYLDRPVRIGRNRAPNGVAQLLLMPSERADIIVDFSNIEPGSNIILRNSAKAPYPDGDAPDPGTLGRIMQFRVVPLTTPDTTLNPADRPLLQQPMVRLVNARRGRPARGVTINKRRSLTLNEMMGPAVTVNGVEYPGGSAGILLNNTRWSGQSPRTYGDFTPVPVNLLENLYSELPQEGQTEVWEIVNLTDDAHPIHLHLVEFQILNRQPFNRRRYTRAYNAAFPGGAYIPAFGPPLDYRADRNPRSGGKDGGNPNVAPFLSGEIKPPANNEAGWKDTLVVLPDHVTRFVVRWAPQDLPVATPAAQALYPFDPNAGQVGYVWHCHILDHEDNEMMRPLQVQPITNAARSYVLGTDY